MRGTFEVYLELGSLRATVAELRRRGWSNKSFVTKGGRHVVGRPFTKATLHGLLTNVLYRGQVRCGDEVVIGVHEPIVDGDLWEAQAPTVLGGQLHEVLAAPEVFQL